MAKTLQFRRGTTSELSSVTGSVGELFVNTEKDTIVVMDGSTSGGFELVNLNASQTLTNKTLTSPVISTISNTGTLTLPTSTGTIALTSDIPTNNNALTNGAGYITASSSDTLTNKSGNISQWTNDAGYLTSFTETNDLTASVTWANVPNANITQSSVTQHQAALSVTESQISDLQSYITATSTDTLTNKTLGATTIAGHLIPDTDVTYDLGSSSFKFRDLYLSGTSINLGDATITASGSSIVLPAGTTVSGGSGATVDLNSTQTLTNKTLTSPTITGTGAIAGIFTGNITGDVTGNADTATTLETARTIGGVSFDGSANINLPGVNTTGNQNTSGNAATATALETTRTIAGKSFDGTANITIAATDLSDTDQSLSTTSNVTFNDLTVSGNLTVSGTTTTVNTETINLADNTITLNSNETGTPTQDGGIEIERGTSANKTLVWNETTDKWTVGSETFVAGTFEGNLTGDVTGNADTATTLATARTIGGVSFDGSANINLPGVNTTGNQDTSGNAATATALETARTIAGQSFDGTANITIASTDLSNTSNITLNDATQTLTNKTLTSPVISTISNTGTLTLPTSTGTVALTSDIPTNNNQLTNGAGYLTSFTETNDLTASVTWANVPNANITQSSVTQHQAALSITESQISDLQSYLTSETNDLTASVTWANIPDANVPQSAVTQHQAALSITESQISDLTHYTNNDVDTHLNTGTASSGEVLSWNGTDYDWVAQSGGGGLSNIVEDTTPQLGGTLDANGNTIDMGTNTITDAKVGNWDTAYGWGDHSAQGYLTSETSHADVVVDGDFTSQGIMLRGASAGSYSILTDNSANWNTAYSWGDHSTQSYLTSTNINTSTSGSNALITLTNSAGGSDSVTLAAGSNITISQSSDTITIASAAGSSYTNSDVDTHLNTSTASSGEVLSWNGSDYDWVAQSGGSSLTIQDEGSTLTTDATTLNFVGAGVTASGSGSTKTINIAGGASTIGALNDVTITSPAINQVLKYNGSVWVNAADATGSGSADLGAVAEDILPSFDEIYDIGSSTFKWYDGYFTNSINIDTISLTNSSGTLAINSDLSVTGDVVLGSLLVDSLLLSENTITADASTAIQYLGDKGVVEINSSNLDVREGDWIGVPVVETTNSVPPLTTGAEGIIRYNKDEGRFEGYNAEGWASLGGLETNADGDSIITGNLVVSGDITSTSDETLKENIKSIEGALDIVTKLSGKMFTMKSDETQKEKVGFIAQEIEQHLPQVVSTDPNGIKSVSYGNVAALLVEAIKELNQKIEDLKK